jgi:hypothetical protein
MVKIARGLALALFFLAACRCDTLASRRQVSMANGLLLDVALEQCRGSDLRLRFAITNSNPDSVVVMAPSLPWQTDKSGGIRVTDLIAGRQLRGEYAIQDPPPERIEIRSGETMSGAVHLAEIYPELRELRNHVIAVSWRVSLETPGRPPKPVSGRFDIRTSR